jgi:hypothetical protein
MHANMLGAAPYLEATSTTHTMRHDSVADRYNPGDEL